MVLLGLSLAECVGEELETITMMVLRMKNHTTVVIVVKGRGMEDVKEARKTGVIRGLPSGLTVLESSPHLHPPPHPHPLTTFPWPLFFIAGGRRDWTAIDRKREGRGECCSINRLPI